MDYAQIFLSSTLSGTAVAVLCTPFDVVKNYWQYNAQWKDSRTSVGTKQVISQIYRENGMRGFWRGLGPALAVIVPANIIFFTLYEKYTKSQISTVRTSNEVSGSNIKLKGGSRYLCETSGEGSSRNGTALAGISARTAAVLFTAPMELIRTKVQASMTDISSAQFLIQSIKQRGFLSLFRGVIPTLIRDVPFSAAYWPLNSYLTSFMFEKIKYQIDAGQMKFIQSKNKHTVEKLEKHDSVSLKLRDKQNYQIIHSDESGNFEKLKLEYVENSNINSSYVGWHVHVFVPFLSGAFASGIACIITHPFDVVKTNIQASPDVKQHRLGYFTAMHFNLIDTFKAIYKQEGFGGFFVGLCPRLSKIVPSCALLLASYEVSKYLSGQSLLDQM